MISSNWNHRTWECVLTLCDLSSVQSEDSVSQSVQLLSRVRLFATPWIAARQASLSITNSRSSLRLTSMESVMPSSHLILCRPLLLLPPIPPSIRVFSNESTLRMRWPSTGISPAFNTGLGTVRRQTDQRLYVCNYYTCKGALVVIIKRNLTITWRTLH